MERVSGIEAVCRRHRVPIAAAALQFPLGHPCVASMIPGAISAEQAERNAGLMRTEVPPDLWAELKREGLMPDAARVPA